MELTDSAALRARLAIRSILRETGVPGGDVISIGEITRAWPRYAVRASDLAPALDALMDEGLLVLEPGSQDVLTLTSEGERWRRQRVGGRTNPPRAPRMSRLRRDTRTTPTDPAALCRRHDDPAPQIEGC